MYTSSKKTYHRAEVNKIRYYSELYRRTCRRNSYTVTYRSKSGEQKCGMIQYFFVSSSVILVAIRPLMRIPITNHDHFRLSDSTIDCIKSITLVEESHAWDVTDLQKLDSKCLFISFPSGLCSDKYVLIFPCEFMHD